jgi:hypothetical protein
LWPGTRQVGHFRHDTQPSSALHGGAFSGAEVDSIRREGQTITADLSAAALQIGLAYAFPNPLVMERDGAAVSFVFQPREAGGSAAAAAPPTRVRIYDLDGSLVRTVSSDGGPVVWDCRNAGGRMVASGTYLFLVEAQGETAQGKVSIVH